MNKNSLVVDVRMINSSGIGTYLKNILPKITDNFSTSLLGNKNELKPYSWSKKCKIIEFHSKLYSLNEQIKYTAIVPKTDLLWCPHFNVPLLPVKAKKIVSTIHDVNHLALSKDLLYIKKKYAKILYNNAVFKSDKIITVSNFSKSELIKYTKVDNSKIEVIYCAINNHFFNENKQNIFQELPKNFILFVGNLKPHKNLITLLKAYLRLSNEIKNKYKIVVLGKKKGFITSDKKAFNFIKKNDLEKNIFFTGYVSDDVVPYIYKNAELFVFPSYYEGFGLPLLEAMTSGVPIISSNAASLTEIGGNAVIYFDPHNDNELKDKIELLLKEKQVKKKYVEKGFARLKLFSWEKAAKEHIEIFKKIIKFEV